MKTLEENFRLAEKISQLDELPLQRVLGILEGIELSRNALQKSV